MSVFAVTANLISAQETDGGLRITGTVDTSFEADTNSGLVANSPGTDTGLRTDLSVSVKSDTPTTSIALTFAGAVQQENRKSGQEKNGFIDPSIGLAFRKEGANSLLSFGATYREEQLDDVPFSELDDSFVDQDVFVSGGDRKTTNVDAAYSFGTSGPLETTLSYKFSERTISGLRSATLDDTRSETLGLTSTAQIAGNVRLRGFAERINYEAQDTENTRRTTTRAGLGVVYEIDPILTFDGSFSLVKIDRRRMVGTSDILTRTDGADIDAKLTREMPNGDVSLSASRNVSTDVTRNEIRVDRNLDLPRGKLSFGAGISDTANSDPVLVGKISYREELPRGVLSLNLARTAVVNSDDQLRTRTTASASYAHELTPISSVDFGLNYAATESGVTGTGRESRTGISVTYRQQLNRDWSWRIGVRGDFREFDTGGSASSTSLTASIGRSFNIRP